MSFIEELNGTLDDLSATMGELSDVNTQTAQTVELMSLILKETGLKQQAERSAESAKTAGFLAALLLCMSAVSPIFTQANRGVAIVIGTTFLIPALSFLAAHFMIRAKVRGLLTEARRAADRRAVLEVLRG